MTPERLQELATLDPGDTPDDARIAITAGDLRDFVSLLPVVHAAILATSGWSKRDLLAALQSVGLRR